MVDFAERFGLVAPKLLQIDSADRELRTSVLNACDRTIDGMSEVMRGRWRRLTCTEFFKMPSHEVPQYSDVVVRLVHERIGDGQWYEVYRYLEHFRIFVQPLALETFDGHLNNILERERSAYRLVKGELTRLSDEAELGTVTTAMGYVGRFGPVTQHIREAARLFSRRPDPDYRNTVKEAISAIEAAARIITGKNTLGKTLADLDRRHGLPSTFRSGIEQLYGWTNGPEGICHAIMETGEDVMTRRLASC